MGRRASVPQEVVRRAGNAIPIDKLAEMWVKHFKELGSTSPRDLWTRGQYERVLAFIDAAKGGGMA